MYKDQSSNYTKKIGFDCTKYLINLKRITEKRRNYSTFVLKSYPNIYIFVFINYYQSISLIIIKYRIFKKINGSYEIPPNKNKVLSNL